jgi:imidazolonepropionase-like amidohydrolase
MADDRFGGSNGVVFTNVRIIDGSGENPYTGEVAVQGNRIRQVTRGSSRLTPGLGAGGGQTVIDGMGATLMPGLCDAHLHLSWNNAPGIDPIQMMPPEEHTLVTAQMAKLVLDAGFTAGRGAAAAKPRLDVVVRNAINSGLLHGPRYLAAGPEITTAEAWGSPRPHPHEVLISASSSLDWKRCAAGADAHQAWRRHYQAQSPGRDHCMRAEETPMSEEEVRMAVRVAAPQCRCRAPSRPLVDQQCIRYGIRSPITPVR